MTQVEILKNIVDLTKSSFVDDNYTPSTIHQLFDDCVGYAIEEMEDYGIEYTEQEITNYFVKHLEL